jgi:hypothetical protein
MVGLKIRTRMNVLIRNNDIAGTSFRIKSGKDEGFFVGKGFEIGIHG